MKSYKKALYYLRLVLFITAILLIFLTMDNYIRIGLWGYIFLGVEFVYIIVMLLTILSKGKLYKTDIIFNIMHIGVYMYQIILSIKMFSFKVSSIIKNSMVFYKNNYIILIILLTILIFYSIVLYGELSQKKIK